MYKKTGQKQTLITKSLNYHIVRWLGVLTFFVIYHSNNLPISIASQEFLTLEDCIDLALKNNELIKIAEKKLIKALGIKQEAFGHFLPTISASAGYTKLSEVPALKKDFMGMPVEFKMGEEENYFTKLTLTQPLFTWGKIYQGNKQAKLNYQWTVEDYRKTKNELILNVKESFYNVLLTKQYVAISKEALEVINGHYKITQALYKEGKVSAYDTSRVKVQLVNAKTKLIEVNNKMELAVKVLLNLINYPQASDWKVKGELTIEPNVSLGLPLEELTKQGLQNRPEMKQIKAQEKMGKIALKLARAENRPSITFIGNYEYKKPFYFENRWDKSWDLTCALTFPFFTGLSNWGKIKQAKATFSQTLSAGDLLRERIKLEVEKAYRNLKEAKERIEAQKENVETARDNLRIAQERYKSGLMSNMEVRDAQLALTQAETNYIKALYDFNIAQAELKKAIGK